MTPGSVRSEDGTAIGYLRAGAGPPLVMVHGSLAVAEAWSAVANLLADSFTCYLMDRRGRGRSNDAPHYSIEREYQDIAAVLNAAGPRPHVIGHSYGAVCALGAALETPVDKLILYEPPVGAVFGSEIENYSQAIDAGDPEKALEIGITKIVGVPQNQFEGVGGVEDVFGEFGRYLAQFDVDFLQTAFFGGAEVRAVPAEGLHGLA